jgi:hypothetical protein
VCCGIRKNMKIKQKIIALSTVLLLLTIPLSIAEANESSEKFNNETLKVEILTAKPDGTLTTEKIILSEEDLAELEYKISQLMDAISSIKDWGSLRYQIEKILGQDNPLLENTLKIFSIYHLSINRGFVISSGHGYDFTPLKRLSFKITKMVAFWHYGSNGLIEDRTIILKPFVPDMKILIGKQFGAMTNFIGIYFFVSKGFLRESYTFFMGTARYINGFDFIPEI